MADEEKKPEEGTKPEAKEGKEGAEAAPKKELPPALFWGAIVGGQLVIATGLLVAVILILPGMVEKKIQASISTSETAEEDKHGEEEHGKEKGHGKEKEKKKKDGHGKDKGGHGKDKGGHGKDKGGHGKDKGGHGGGHGGEEEKPPEDFILSEILVNVAGTRGARYVKASLYFESPPHVRLELEAKRPKVIDLVSQVLSSKTLEELTADDSRGTLRAEILQMVNTLLPDDKVNNIYFLDFIIQ